MRASISAAFIAMFLLTGCAGGDAGELQALQEKVTALEQRVTTLEENLQQARLDLAAKDNEVAKLKEDLRTVATIVDKNSVRIDRIPR